MTFPFESLRASQPELEEEASANDRDGGFPIAGLARLRSLGGMSAALPQALGGFGLGTEPKSSTDLMRLLRLTGEGNLSLGRLLEGHVNAIRLVFRYGSAGQLHRLAAAIHDGALAGIWVTETTNGVRMTRVGSTYALHGEKMFASGALHVTRPLITAETTTGETRMLVVPLDAARKATESIGGLCGMRGAGTGACDFSGMHVTPDALVGQAGDYLRQPEFSVGAWRGMAVALGGIDRLVTLFRKQLVARGRETCPAQKDRIGLALIAKETAALWTSRAARVAEDAALDPDEAVAIVNLARIAVERAGLDVIELVQRGLGLSAFVKTNVVERIMRDLATYLRQPAPDETLAEAATYFTHNEFSRA
ncbi:acyl-CoA dehydrogenase [Acetobacter estunensis NRIC 0472]|uniref:Acyl-CoA dehydrogenase n=1 Tax=Acetobacter estunensis TaxID=104097 RepID=A0A967EJC1_9PROT|nr:acyl-CoA dehydrogenase [Acetobacter estunensis]NHO54714.1 acyl-CoA dehydrogenase [Acetobacter estunensis]GBQ21311.1 acyl-CoA dehydrogenase [Acetobacter estunensis NRIC 0472]